jgi:hypothetical protein
MTFEEWWEIFLQDYHPGAFADTLFKSTAKHAWEAAQEAIPAMGFSEWAEDFSERTHEDLEGEDEDIARSAWASGFQKGRKTVGFGE